MFAVAAATWAIAAVATSRSRLLPIVQTTYDGPITAKGAELVGNYALRIDFSDGHSTGIYTFEFLRELDAILADESAEKPH